MVYILGRDFTVSTSLYQRWNDHEFNTPHKESIPTARYNERLEESLKEVLLISELSLWTRRKRDQRKTYSLFITEHDDDPIANGAELLNNAVQSEAVSDANVGASESGIQLDKLMDFSKVLEPWEEPDVGPQEVRVAIHVGFISVAKERLNLEPFSFADRLG